MHLMCCATCRHSEDQERPVGRWMTGPQ
jgi:hypothetical protein